MAEADVHFDTVKDIELTVLIGMIKRDFGKSKFPITIFSNKVCLIFFIDKSFNTLILS